jgi:hypothetical protein
MFSAWPGSPLCSPVWAPHPLQVVCGDTHPAHSLTPDLFKEVNGDDVINLLSNILQVACHTTRHTRSKVDHHMHWHGARGPFLSDAPCARCGGEAGPRGPAHQRASSSVEGGGRGGGGAGL